MLSTEVKGRPPGRGRHGCPGERTPEDHPQIQGNTAPAAPGSPEPRDPGDATERPGDGENRAQRPFPLPAHAAILGCCSNVWADLLGLRTHPQAAEGCRCCTAGESRETKGVFLSLEETPCKDESLALGVFPEVRILSFPLAS